MSHAFVGNLDVVAALLILYIHGVRTHPAVVEVLALLMMSVAS